MSVDERSFVIFCLVRSWFVRRSFSFASEFVRERNERRTTRKKSFANERTDFWCRSFANERKYRSFANDLAPCRPAVTLFVTLLFVKKIIWFSAYRRWELHRSIALASSYLFAVVPVSNSKTSFQKPQIMDFSFPESSPVAILNKRVHF